MGQNSATQKIRDQSDKRNLLITGASKGIGLAIAKRMGKMNWNVVGLARTTGSSDFPGDLIACDLSDVEATRDTLNYISQKYQIHGIVNNVGIALPQRLEEIDLTNLIKVFDLNVRVAVQVTQHFAADMRADRFGRIVNIASRAVAGTAGRTAYAAAKSALVACTNTWAIELANDAITVNSILPGPIETELFRQTRPAGSREEQEILDTILLNRIGTPVEVADAVAFFLSDQASFITGQHLGIDGGRRW